MTPGFDVAVIGGGVAGIAAAVRLAESGARTILIDKRPFLGGRASSFVDAQTGMMADVCQHVTLGCCTKFEALLDAIGTRPSLKYIDAILMQDRDGRRIALKASPLPVPFRLAPSLFRIPWLGWKDRLAAARLMQRIPRDTNDPGALEYLDLATWANRNGATPGLIRGLLEPIVVSACNAGLSAVSAKMGFAVLDQLLLRSPDGHRPGIFTKPLGEVFTEPVQAAAARSGGTVRLRTNVTAVLRGGPARYRVMLGRHGEITASACVLAVPWNAVPRLLPTDALTDGIMKAAKLLRPGTIVSTHHWFADQLDCPEALALIGRSVHWVFNKSVTFGPGYGDGCYVTTVTSDANELGRLDGADILRLAREDILAGTRDRTLPTVRHERAFVERQATFVPAPGVGTSRPSCATAWPDLVIAGDWTDTGWPSTMESAARSGLAAAETLLRLPS